MRATGLLPFLPLPLAACLGTAPPAPPPRCFDPLPVAAGAPAGAPRELRVTAAPHLGREFAVRVAARELAFDAQHVWLAEPRLLVETALQARCAPSPGPRAPQLHVHVEAFEVDVTGPPLARIRCVVTDGAAAPRPVLAEAPASDRSPPALAAAMAQALAKALDALLPAR